MKKFLERSKGFTLVELMVVIAIIGILAVVALGIVRGAQQRAVNAAIKATATNLTTAIESYYTVAGVYPTNLSEMWANGAGHVLDGQPSLPSSCDVSGNGGYYSGTDVGGACGIAYSAVTPAKGYTLTYKDLTNPKQTINGGYLGN
jgi:prepilin-type N-terminal cleavage/methylation domain-containing protein